MKLTNSEKILLIVAAVSVLTATVVVLSVVMRIRNVGRIKAVGVKFYWDSACTDEATEIDWGTLSPGGLYGVTLYCKNIKNTPVTLNMTTNNWLPSNANLYIYPDWNYTGETLNPGDIIPIQFQLSISTNITNIENFSFDFVIGVTEKLINLKY